MDVVAQLDLPSEETGREEENRTASRREGRRDDGDHAEEDLHFRAVDHLSMESRELDEKLSEMHISGEPLVSGEIKVVDDNVQITCFMEDLHDATLHFQIIKFPKQIYAWIGCNSAKFGHLYAAAIAPPSNTANVASLLRGNAENTGSSMARRMALKTGLSVVLACNIPKNSPILEATAERKLIEKLRILGYIRPS